MHGIAEAVAPACAPCPRPPPPSRPACAAATRSSPSTASRSAAGPSCAGKSCTSALDKRDVRLDVERRRRAAVAAMVPAGRLGRGLDADADLLGALGLDGRRGRPPVLGKVIAGGAAERAGLRDRRPGHRGRRQAGAPTASSSSRRCARPAAARCSSKVSAAGAPLTLPVTPERDPATGQGRIKAEVALAPEMVTVAVRPGRGASRKAVRKTWDTSALTVKMIGKMITGEVSLKNVTGPITIADYAGQTARMGAGDLPELHRLHQHQPGRDESVTNSGSGWGAFAVLFAGSFDRTPLARADRRICAARRRRPCWSC